MAKHPGRVRSGKRTSSKIWPRKCPHCQVDFLGTGKQIFCTRRCKEAAELVARKTQKCEQCGKTIAARKRQRFCSLPCKTLWTAEAKRSRVGKADTCRQCGASFIVQASAERYCSRECKTVAASQKRYQAKNPVVGLLKTKEALDERPDTDQ